MTGCSTNESEDWGDPVIPVSLVDIEVVNIDNSGELPVISASPIKKEAYMVGIKWITDYDLSDDDDKFITDVIQKGEQTYSSLSRNYSKAIKCNTPFNANIPAGKYVSKFFKEINSNYLPTGIDEGFVLLVAPDPGEHSFRVEYYEGDVLKFFHDTPTIIFY
jgi:hypothetical protein